MTEDIKFRHAQLTDLQDIVVLLADDILGEKREDTSFPTNARYVDAFKAIDADPNQAQLAVTLDDKLIGTFQLTFIPGLARLGSLRGQIEGVRIAPKHRGSGVGQKMLEWAIAECRSRGCDIVQLTTDKDRPDAHRFYEKLGFLNSHLGYKLKLVHSSAERTD